MKTLALAVALLTAAPLGAADLADVKARGTLRVIVMLSPVGRWPKSSIGH